MKVIKTLFTLAVALLALTACNNEDDIAEIFVNRTWYMNGIAINGTTSSEETRNFYKDTDSQCYYITFSSDTFYGALSSGITFSGTWNADGKHQKITLHLQQKTASNLIFDKQMYQILSSITSYKSGADFLQLYDDNQNIIRLGTMR